MISLDKEMRKLLASNYSFVIVKRLTNIKCNCWRNESNTPDPNHPRCEGSGYIFKEYIVKCIKFYVTENRVSHMQDFDYGRTYSNLLTTYFEINDISNKFRIDDIIYEIESKVNPKKVRKWIITDLFNFKLENDKAQFIKILSKPAIT